MEDSDLRVNAPEDHIALVPLEAVWGHQIRLNNWVSLAAAASYCVVIYSQALLSSPIQTILSHVFLALAGIGTPDILP
jgi:hypothetical protein